MSNQTKIEWADSTFNPWIGCTKVSPACDHCYAERDTKRFNRVEWGAGKPRVRTVASNWAKPVQWNKQPFRSCACGYRGTLDQMTTNALHGCGLRFMAARRRVFSASLADWLDNEVPIEWLVDFFDVICRTPNLDWLLLTKRIGNWRARLEQARDCQRINHMPVTLGMVIDWLGGRSPANVWLGSTVEHAPRKVDIDKLRRVPARVRFLSCEPLIDDFGAVHLADIHWVIVGGESGPHARPMHPHWVRSLRDQCAAAHVPFLFKQWGEWQTIEDMSIAAIDRTPGSAPGHRFADGVEVYRVGKKLAGRLLDGIEHNGFPCA